MNNGYQAERLPQKGECREDSEGGILESASTFAYRVLKEIEALAGTTACKSVQLVRLKQWAQEQGRWFDDRTQFGDFFDRGSENEVYLSQNGTEIIKLNDFRYSDDNLTPFFERIKAHNSYFPDCSYCLVGFAENRDGNVCAVLVQPFIAEARLATEQEIHDEFIRLGFHSEDDGGYYTIIGINVSGVYWAGVFGATLAPATISNITLEGNCFFNSTNSSGGIVGYNNGEISGCRIVRAF